MEKSYPGCRFSEQGRLDQRGCLGGLLLKKLRSAKRLLCALRQTRSSGAAQLFRRIALPQVLGDSGLKRYAREIPNLFVSSVMSDQVVGSGARGDDKKTPPACCPSSYR